MMEAKIIHYRDVLCASCERVHQVPVEWAITEPYHCTLCIKRAARRMVMEAEQPPARRMQHGTVITGLRYFGG